MSLGYAKRAALHPELRNVRLTSESPSRHRPIPRRLYAAGRIVWNAGIVAAGFAVTYVFLLAVMSLQ